MRGTRRCGGVCSAKGTGVEDALSKILGCQARVPRDSSEHARSDLIVVVEGEPVIWAARTGQRAMRAGRALGGSSQGGGEPELGGPSSQASGLRGEKGDGEEFWRGPVGLQAFSDDPERQGLDG